MSIRKRIGTGWRPHSLTLAGLVALGMVAIASQGASAAPGPTDLSITKNDSADPVLRGSNFSYTIQVANPGPNDAENVTVVDSLPSQVRYLSATASSGTCREARGIVTCELGTLLSGATASVTITMRAQREGTATNSATVSTTSGDPNGGNNQDTETTTIQGKGQAKRASCASPTISGTAGDDLLVGTNGPDVIRAFAGNDRVFGGGGRDLICADRGNDLVSGGPKGDTIIGGGGRDKLFGNRGGDVLKGKKGRDRLRGNLGNDVLNGGSGRDNCKGGAGRDKLKRCP